ncbi:MAG: hypothetical protein ACYS9C_08070, partial [Planctomycetota bacterium]
MSADDTACVESPPHARERQRERGEVTTSSRQIAPRVGVFICHCGINIAKTVDVKRVAEEIAKEPGVVIAQDYQYTCSVPGQQMIVDGVREHNLNR